MEFKEGDRVHVIQHNGRSVDFYATLRELSKNFFLLTNCTDEKFKGNFIRKPEINCFGPNRTDYYTLATDENKGLRWSDGSSAEGTPIMCDEEDTEEPVIQRINDTVNHPSHYNFGDIEVVDFIEQVTKHYNSDVAYHIGNAIKYISRAPHKNGKEDIAKAKWYIERAFENWE